MRLTMTYRPIAKPSTTVMTLTATNVRKEPILRVMPYSSRVSFLLVRRSFRCDLRFLATVYPTSRCRCHLL